MHELNRFNLIPFLRQAIACRTAIKERAWKERKNKLSKCVCFCSLVSLGTAASGLLDGFNRVGFEHSSTHFKKRLRIQASQTAVLREIK